MKTIIHTLCFCAVVSMAGAQTTEPALQAYLQIKDTLVLSDSKTASGSAAEFLKVLQAQTAPSEVIEAAQKLASSKDLEKQREAFAGLSLKMREFLGDNPGIPQKVYYQYCPMKKAYWLSLNEEIKNPYYGNKMLGCGTTKEIINP